MFFIYSMTEDILLSKWNIWGRGEIGAIVRSLVLPPEEHIFLFADLSAFGDVDGFTGVKI